MLVITTARTMRESRHRRSSSINFSQLMTSSGLTVFMLFFLLALIMSPLEMVLQSYRLLEPWLYLSFQAYKLTFAIIFVIVQTVEYTNADWNSLAAWIRYLMLVLIIITVVMA